jgi:hypothetical protein
VAYACVKLVNQAPVTERGDVRVEKVKTKAPPPDRSRALLSQYAARFLADTARTDLASWHRFETENPRSFAAMYQFWVQKPEQA